MWDLVYLLFLVSLVFYLCFSLFNVLGCPLVVFFPLSSLIFYAQFVSKLPIECGCLIGMQGSNYGITCEYSSVTIIQVRIEGIACSLKQLLRQYSPKAQCSFNLHHHRSVLLVLSFVYRKHTRHTKHIFLSHSLWVFNFKWLISVPFCGNVFKILSIFLP